MLTAYGTREWSTILAIGLVLGGALLFADLGWAALLVLVLTVALLTFFRDPRRRVPTQRGVIVSPADGLVSSVHQLEHFEPLAGPAVCIRIFLSIFDVHVNRSPCHAAVESIQPSPGRHDSALRSESAAVNESNLLVLAHPTRRQRIAAVRQVAGMFARTIVCGVQQGQILQRGQRFGMIKLGSTTELYLPLSIEPQVLVQTGQRVRGGQTVVARSAAPAQLEHGTWRAAAPISISSAAPPPATTPQQPPPPEA